MALNEIFEVNVSNDFTVYRSGEPEIAINPTNANNLVMVYTEYGIDEGPTRYGYSRWFEPGYPNAGLALSFDRGETWEVQPKPFPTMAAVTAEVGWEDLMEGWNAGPPLVCLGDPMVATGPDGTFYIAAVVNIAPVAAVGHGGVAVVSSSDGGRTWTEPVLAGPPWDRPLLRVDPIDGTVYLASAGPLRRSTDRWVSASRDQGRTWTKPRGIAAGGPLPGGMHDVRGILGPDSAFSVSSTSTIAAAHGVLAAAFQVAFPASLAHLLSEPIPAHVFFQTSTDDGATWERHYVPVTGDGSSRVQVSADPNDPGRFAVGVPSPGCTELLVVKTTDAGQSWTQPAHVGEDASQGHYMQWMDYSPDGVLGLVWRTPTEPYSGSLGAFFAPLLPYDIWTAISPDGGVHWSNALRVNAAPSPAPGPSNLGDDLSWITLDRDHVHVGWGDWRGGDRNSWYGRVPVSAYSRT
jgi:hypothetical protein